VTREPLAFAEAMHSEMGFPTALGHGSDLPGDSHVQSLLRCRCGCFPEADIPADTVAKGELLSALAAEDEEDEEPL
jgi:hypothetical protein